MAAYYLAVDIGASSGRHILGHMENGKMVLEEIYRFENGMVKKDGELCWEFDRLFKEVVNGLKKCKEIGKLPVSMGVDTWGVDFVLLDRAAGGHRILRHLHLQFGRRLRRFHRLAGRGAGYAAFAAIPARLGGPGYPRCCHWYRRCSATVVLPGLCRSLAVGR